MSHCVAMLPVLCAEIDEHLVAAMFGEQPSGVGELVIEEEENMEETGEGTHTFTCTHTSQNHKTDTHTHMHMHTHTHTCPPPSYRAHALTLDSLPWVSAMLCTIQF